jgi:hypothetical protein
VPVGFAVRHAAPPAYPTTRTSGRVSRTALTNVASDQSESEAVTDARRTTTGSPQPGRLHCPPFPTRRSDPPLVPVVRDADHHPRWPLGPRRWDPVAPVSVAGDRYRAGVQYRPAPTGSARMPIRDSSRTHSSRPRSMDTTASPGPPDRAPDSSSSCGPGMRQIADQLAHRTRVPKGVYISLDPPRSAPGSVRA